MYSTQFEIELKSHGDITPIVSYGVDSITDTCAVTESKIIKIDTMLNTGDHKFILNFQNKPENNSDMAVEIVRVTVEGIAVDRFKWSSCYYPNYPATWASQQSNLPEYYKSGTYMGWNGCWEFYFSTPIFRWIHQLENLGWIYV